MKCKKRTNRWFYVCILSFFVIICMIFFVKRATASSQHVPIAMALDDGYLYPTVVSITSAMENKNPGTFYDYYIMHPENFSDESKSLLKSLEEKYKNCSINLVDMGEKYKNANDKGHITTPAYYRLSMSDVLPQNVDIALWIDGDTLVLDDLSQMLKIDMNGLYYRGFLDDTVDATESLGVHNDHCICSGVMLVNLGELRKDDMVNKFQKFIEENNDRLVQHDQTVINVVCVDKIGKLDPRYGLFNYYCDTSALRYYYNLLRAKDKYTMDELVRGRDNLVIAHCVCKPWKGKFCFFNEWWRYAASTSCYDKIREKYSAVFDS